MSFQLTRVEIEGFRTFQAPFSLELTSPFGEPLDYLVLAGPNGCGKTTVLEAILLALGREQLIVRDDPPAAREGSPRLELGTRTRLSVLLHLSDTPRAASGGDSPATLFRVERSQGGTLVSYQANESWIHTEWALFEDRLSALQVEYLSSRRLPARIGPVQDSLRGRPPEATEANRIWLLKQRIRQQQGRRVPGYVGPTPLDELWLERLNLFWGVFRGDGSRLVMTLVDPLDLDASDWDLFLYQGERRICAVDALSSGEQEVIALVAPFVTQDFRGLLLIDEPELHLHPEWQSRVMPAVRALLPEAQIVVATHADAPWDDAMSWERVLLVDDDDPRSVGS